MKDSALARYTRNIKRAVAGETPIALVVKAQREFASVSPAMRFIKKVVLPEGRSGDYILKTFAVSEEAAMLFNLKESFKGHRFIHPGVYTKIMDAEGQSWMSDTPAEMEDHIEIVDRAYHHGGYVLILGLGLGMVVQAVLDMPQVTGCTVVEISDDVIKLVAPTYQKRYGERFKLVKADALKWVPDHLYSAVWADIWPTLSPDNLREVSRLKRRYREHGWFGAWGVELIRAMSREMRKEMRVLRALRT